MRPSEARSRNLVRPDFLPIVSRNVPVLALRIDILLACIFLQSTKVIRQLQQALPISRILLGEILHDNDTKTIRLRPKPFLCIESV